MQRFVFFEDSLIFKLFLLFLYSFVVYKYSFFFFLFRWICFYSRFATFSELISFRWYLYLFTDHIELIADFEGNIIFIKPRDISYIPSLRLLHKYPFMMPHQQVEFYFISAKFYLFFAENMINLSALPLLFIFILYLSFFSFYLAGINLPS